MSTSERIKEAFQNIVAPKGGGAEDPRRTAPGDRKKPLRLPTSAPQPNSSK